MLFFETIGKILYENLFCEYLQLYIQYIPDKLFINSAKDTKYNVQDNITT